jgi:chromosome segregation ATPase
MANKEKTKLALETVPNGYALRVDEQEFMYFNKIDLLAGFLAHVGMEETNSMDKGTVLSTLFAAMMGEAYTDAVTTIKQRVALLAGQYTTTIENMDKAIDYVTQSERQINGMTHRLKIIEDSIRATDALYAANKKEVADTSTHIAGIETRLEELSKQADAVFDKLTNILKVQQTIEEAKKDEKPKKAEKKSDEKSVKNEKPAEKVKKSSRQIRDEKIMAAIEEKAKKNKNIK